MNYWHILARAHEALAEDRFRPAEEAFSEAASARRDDARRVFFSETIPDGARSLWRRLRKRGGHAAPARTSPEDRGRWARAEARFREAFRSRSESMLRGAQRQLETGVAADPAGAARMLAEAMYLSVGSRLAARRLPAAQILSSLFELLPQSGRLCAHDLVTRELDLSAAVRLKLAERALPGLAQLSRDERIAWAARILDLLDDQGTDWHPGSVSHRQWLAARLADHYGEDATEVVARWRVCDEPGQSETIRRWSRLRRLEILAGRDRRRLSAPCYGEAHRLADLLSPPMNGEEQSRCRDAMSVIAYRRPATRPSRAWATAGATRDGAILAVFWWAGEPRDVARWEPTDGEPAIEEFLEAVEGRVVWDGTGPPEQGSILPESFNGRQLTPYLETILEPILPEGGWSREFARRLALARCGAWRSGWRADLGHPLLAPPGQDGLLTPAQQDIEPMLHAGLLWLAVLHRVNTADPALRAGLGELSRRGDPAAAFLHEFAVLGAPDRAAVDAGFAAWTLPLLWSRPDPLSFVLPAQETRIEQEDLAGHDAAVVVTGEPSRALSAWGEGVRRWRGVLDRWERLGAFGRLAREGFGPVTVVPHGGVVHDLRAALDLLDRLAAAGPQVPDADQMLAIYHWIRLVESHNGDLLDNLVLRPRAPGICPWLDRYAAMVADLPVQPVPACEPKDDQSWAPQYVQRARRSGLVLGLVDDLPAQPRELDDVWGVYDGSDASWVFLDSAAVHWRLHEHGPERMLTLHRLLASRGRRHLSLLSGRGLFFEDLAAWLDRALAPYGQPYHRDLKDARPPLLRLAGNGPLPGSHLAPGAAGAAALTHLKEACPQTFVHGPRHGIDAAFWSAAAAGAFGPAAWRLAEDQGRDPVRRLVVPQWAALGAPGILAAPQDDTVAGWRQADCSRIERLACLRCLVALECGALLARPAGQVEILDGRWWRLFGPLEQAPDAGDRDGVSIEIMQLAEPRPGDEPSRLERAVTEWLVGQGRVAGLVPGWAGPPLAEGRPLAGAGIRHHVAPASSLWRDLAAEQLRLWEQGRPLGRLLILSEVPPAGAGALASLCAGPGATVLLDGCGDRAAGALLWARSADLAACLQRGEDMPSFERVLLLDFVRQCPPSPQAIDGARLLARLAAGTAARLDLVGDPCEEPWSRFLADSMGVVFDGGARQTAWATLRRGEVPRTGGPCPQCGQPPQRTPDGIICGHCSYDLAGPGPRPEGVEVAAARADRLMAQGDLGREEPLEIWADRTDLRQIEHLLPRRQAARHEAGENAWLLPDGRRWRLCDLSGPVAVSAGRAVLLRPARGRTTTLRPWPGGTSDESLTLLYDRLEIACSRLDASPAATGRFLRFLRRAPWLQGPAAGPPDAPGPPPSVWTVPLWQLAWLTGRTMRAVRHDLEMLQWVAVLTAGLAGGAQDRPPAARTRSAGARWRVNVSLRDSEQQLKELASRAQSLLEDWLADGLAGAWHPVQAPGMRLAGDEIGPHRGTCPQAPSDIQLDHLLALLGEDRPVSGPRLVYAAPQGAWFGSRRLVGWLGDRALLGDVLSKRIEDVVALMRATLCGASIVDAGFFIDAKSGPPASCKAQELLPQLLGFWSRHGPAGPHDIAVLDLEQVARSPALAGGGPGSRLLQELAESRDCWLASLESTPVGGRIVSTRPAPRRETAVPRASRWWPGARARGTKFPLQDEVSAWAAREAPSRMVLAGSYGTGRSGSAMAGLAASEHGRAAVFWCPDEAAAVRLHMQARRLDPAWQPVLRIADSGEHRPAMTGRAPGERVIHVIAELQRWPQEVSYRLQERARDAHLLLSVDTADLRPATTWEDLFLTTPSRDEVRRLKAQWLQSRQLWLVTRSLLPQGQGEQRTQRRERGVVIARRAGTLEECAAAIDAASAAGNLGRVVRLVLPLPEDLPLMARAMVDRGWMTILERDLQAHLLPGVLETLAALADAHRSRNGTWPGQVAGDASREEPSMLAGVLPPGQGRRYEGWLQGLSPQVLGSASVFLTHLRRSPWGVLCCAEPSAGRRVTALAEQAQGPGDVLPLPMWEAWRSRLEEALGRSRAAVRPAVACLSAAAEVLGEPARSLAYLCFGPEPVSVHRRVIMRATDRLLVLYQEHSPLPDQWEA